MRRAAYLGAFILIAVAGAGVVLGREAARPQTAQSGGGPRAAATVSTPSPPADQGEAKGSVLDFRPGGGNLRASVLAQPLPQVWLEFPSQSSPGGPGAEKAEPARVDLPEEARDALTHVWQAYLAYHFEINFGGDEAVRKRVELDVAMVTTAARTAAGLEELSVNAPDGARKISYDEALEVVSFLGGSAKRVVEQAKEHQK